MSLDIWSRLLASKARRTDGLEAWSALVTLAWGATLLLPGDTFATTISYATLASLGDERFWVAVCFSVAVMQSAGLVSSWLLGGREMRIIGAVCGAAFWGTLGGLLFASNPIGHGWMLYTSLSAGMTLTAWSLHGDKRIPR